MPLWAWLWSAVPILGAVLTWMVRSGWWNDTDRANRKYKEKRDG